MAFFSTFNSSAAVNEGVQLACTPPSETEINEEHYLPLYTAIMMGDWEKAQEFLNVHRDALAVPLNDFFDTALHVACSSPENIKVLENLLELLDPRRIPYLVNYMGHNPLHYAAILDNTKAVKKLVKKYPDLLFILDSKQSLPIDIAILNSHRDTFLYLLKKCKKHIELSEKDGYYNPFTRATILQHTISAGFFDVAYNLLKDYPKLAITNTSWSPLYQLAQKRDAFLSDKRYNFYQRFIYSRVPEENYDLGDTRKNQDIENQETYRASLVTGKTYLQGMIKRIYVKFWKVALLYVPHIKHLHQDKVNHKTALAILKFICEEASKLNFSNYPHYRDALFFAGENNIPEVVEQIVRVFPRSIWGRNQSSYSLSQIAIVNRSEKVYNFLVHEVTRNKYLHNVTLDNCGNNLLHLAGKLAPKNKLDIVTGATLQMQRELQWFQEVSKLVRPREREAKNINNHTPIMVFRQEHENLRQKGEEWLKKTADSYTITAALIITIVFAAAITVPGGNNGETGRAIYRTDPSFIIFIVSDAISLFTSTTSLLFFLSILTARYAEDDFLYKLPKRLILGLVMLFISVTTMLIAFSSTLYIMSGKENSWILIPIAGITCLTITTFVTLQLPLLYDLISSTYGPGIFRKRSEHRITS